VTHGEAGHYEREAVVLRMGRARHARANQSGIEYGARTFELVREQGLNGAGTPSVDEAVGAGAGATDEPTKLGRERLVIDAATDGDLGVHGTDVTHTDEVGAGPIAQAFH